VSEEYVFVKINERYAARAEYYYTRNNQSDVIVAFDGTRPRRVLVSDQCGEDDCYAAINDEVDLRIKYWE
jgi:hypothetical protein